MSAWPRPGQPVSRVGRRGQPVIMLALVLGGWSLLRAATWIAPELPLLAPDEPSVAVPGAAPAPAARSPQRTAPRAVTARDGGTMLSPAWPYDEAQHEPGPQALQPQVVPQATPMPIPAPLASPLPPRATPQRAAAGHAMLMAAGFSQLELPPALAAWYNARRAVAAPAAPSTAPSSALAQVAAREASSPPVANRASRWGADAWLLWRDDTTTPITSGRPSYGRSQAGVVARYRLAPASGHAPQAYLRGSAALQGAREEDVALGLSARPLQRVPLRVAAELRATQRAGGSELRPAVFAVTELPPQDLPLGASAEIYVQGGYVGGQARTAFIDGQARIDRSVARVDDFDLRAGGGTWGGAQRGNARLDVGPSASVTFRMGDARGRVAADYRFRVAGDAQPASGPALTLSAGF